MSAWLIHHYASVRYAGPAQATAWRPLKLARMSIVLCSPINEQAEREHNERIERAARAFEAAFPDGL